jgi:hypothetical protein
MEELQAAMPMEGDALDKLLCSTVFNEEFKLNLKLTWALENFRSTSSLPIESEKFETWIARKYVQFQPSDKEIQVGQIIEYADPKARVTSHVSRLQPPAGDLYNL